VSKRAEKWLPRASQGVRAKVVSAKLHNEAGIVGAAMAAWKSRRGYSFLPIPILFQILIHSLDASYFFCPKSFFEASLAFRKVVTAEDRVVEVIKD